MDFDTSFIDTCSFCEQEIKLTPIKCLGNENLKFCDLCCAKLYNDNVQNINVDMTNYRRAYQRDQLNPLAKVIYEKIDTLFEMLPLYKVPMQKSHSSAKNEYIKIFIK